MLSNCGVHRVICLRSLRSFRHLAGAADNDIQNTFRMQIRELRKMIGSPNSKSKLFDDNGNEINTDLLVKLSFCVSCFNDDDPYEEISCILTRYDQQGESDFNRGVYEQKKGN